MAARAVFLAALMTILGGSAGGHDIPNARVDRSTQATVEPGRLRVHYEVSLSELTLTQDLRALIGPLPRADREEWFRRYGVETGPLNARGFLVSVDGLPVDLVYASHDLVVEDHPRYVFHLEAPIPSRGRLTIRDTNYQASEGTSRLAVRGLGGAIVRGDDLPGDVESIEIRPVWMLSDAEEERTRLAVVEFETPDEVAEAEEIVVPGPPIAPEPDPPPSRDGLSGLLDRAAGLSPWVAGLLAFGLGAIHAVQPGHGKLLVAAAVVGERGAWWRGAALALTATAAHTASVALVAGGLWLTRSARYGEIDRALAQASGFAIAAIGLWRVGRHLAGYGEHDGPAHDSEGAGGRGLLGLGLAAGAVPCWDAIGLVVVAEAVGRLSLGLALLVTFGLGMALVLVAVGLAAGRVRRMLVGRGEPGCWERRLGLIGGLVLATIGLALFEGARA